MNSALYRGWVRHRRFRPRQHEFRYRVCMVLLDLAEVESLAQRNWLWSKARLAPVSFRREDHFGDPDEALEDSVRNLVESETGTRPRGKILLLTNPRYWGYCFNPISVYYCFGTDGATVTATVAEVTNTPWGERCCYVLPGQDGPALDARFAKALHVSPFMPMDQNYRWRGRSPGKTLSVHLENHQGGALMLDATMALRRQPLTAASLATALVAYPFMTARIIVAIHWQALRLWRKGLRVHAYPGSHDRLLDRAPR